MKQPKILIIAAALLIIGGSVGIWWWHATGVTQQQVASLLPRTPDLQQQPPALQEQIRIANDKARARSTALKGLAELGRLYHANGFFEEALHCYRGLAQLEPKEPRWPHLHASIIAGYGDTDTALELWRNTLKLSPDYVPALLRSGDCLLKANQRPAATAAYEAVLQREKDNPYALLGLARLDLEAQQWEQARQKLELVVNKTNYTLGYDLIVSLYERMGLDQRAAAIRGMAKASGAYRDPPDPWHDELLEVCFEPYRLSLAAGTIARNGDPAYALQLLQRAVAVAPDDVSVRFQLGTLLVEQGQLPAALEQLERCTIFAPDFSDGWAHLSALQARLGRTSAAAGTLATGLKNCPLSPGLHLTNARVLLGAGKIEEAIYAFQTSIRLRSNEPEAYIELGNLLIRQGRNAEGLAEMQRALEVEPGNPMALSILTFNAIMTGDENEARRWFESARAQPRVPREQLGSLTDAFRRQFGRAP